MTRGGESFEDAIEDIERENGIIGDPKKHKPRIEIVADEYGRFWRYNETGTMKWRVDINGNGLNLGWEKMVEEEKFWERLLANEQDLEVKAVLEEENLYRSVGGTANQWQQLEEKKDDLRRRGKRYPNTKF